MKLANQVAIVTGAGRNIGEDVSKLLSKNGATIAVVVGGGCIGGAGVGVAPGAAAPPARGPPAPMRPPPAHSRRLKML